MIKSSKVVKEFIEPQIQALKIYEKMLEFTSSLENGNCDNNEILFYTT